CLAKACLFVEMASNSQPPGAQPFWPPIGGSAGPPQNFAPPMSMQFQVPFPQQQANPFNMAASQHFRPVGPGSSASNMGLHAGQNQQQHYPQMMQQLPPRSGQQSLGPPSSQAVPPPFVHPNRPLTSIPSQPLQNTQHLNNHMSSVGGMGTPLSSSYTFAYSHPQNGITTSSQYQPMSHMPAPVTSLSGQTSVSSGSQTAAVAPQQSSQQPSVTSATALATNLQPRPTTQSSADWIEHTSADGKRYYYNKRSKLSSWEKPLELMSPIERADASTDWKEVTSPDGRRYYYNKVTRQSTWSIPDEMKLAREQVERGDTQLWQPEIPVTSQVPVSVTVSPEETSPILSSAISAVSSPVPVVPVAAVVDPLQVVTSGQPSIPIVPSSVSGNDIGAKSPWTILEDVSLQEAEKFGNGVSLQDLEEVKKSMAVAGKVNVTALEEKAVEAEPLTYATKQEAKDAFKALLESANVESDWNWEQAMRVIINDKRYGALRTLGERKQTFTEIAISRSQFTYLSDILGLNPTYEVIVMKSYKAIAIFEDDERLNAVERVRDREDLFESYLAELKKKEKAKAHEEHKRNIREYKQFLQSCDFIKANSQWRKIQDRLEEDERCSRLEKLDRLDIFQEYINELEKEEEEQRKLQKEQMRRAERNNRDEFRKLMEGHVGDGTLTAKTHWREYHEKVKDSPQYVAASSNTSGATPKVLFEDVTEDLQKQYHDDKARIKEAIKLRKITMTSTWTLEDLKTAIAEELSSSSVSDINLELVFNELLEREINSTSTWDDCKPLFEDSQEYRSMVEESFKKDVFEEYITHLQEKAKEKERKRMEEKEKKEKERGERERRKEKDRKEKEREHGRDKGEERSKKVETVSGNADVKDVRKREKEKDRKHRKRRQNEGDDISSGREEKEDIKKSHRHKSDGKKSRKHVNSNESDSESRHKRHKREHRHHRNGAYDDFEDGELGEDGEIR
ncbi:hypothetical protein IFM89_020242, partial [Coptis chinensis]